MVLYIREDYIMKTELCNYDIYPKVFPAGKQVEVTIKPLGSHAAFPAKELTLRVCPLGEGSPGTYPSRPNNTSYTVTPSGDGCIRFAHTYPNEQEYYIRVYDENRRIVQLAVYALEGELVGRYPWRGDLHMHTCRSDGREQPAVVCANYRKNGYDFFAITDHGRYYPSLEAISDYKDVPIEFNIVPGEEIHLPGNDIHIVGFGANWSINGLLEGTAQTNESKKRAIVDNPPPVISVDEYKRQVNELAETLDIPDGIEKFTYAACVWIFNRIREAGGLGIFAHPYWISDVFQVPESLTDYLMEKAPFDAFEVLGGENYYEQNGFQTIKYYDDRAKGRDYPIVGSTDSHGSVNNPNSLICSTIVFAPENERENLIGAIKDKLSVAVDTISKEYRLVGDFRLVKYAQFLLDNFYPLHDELCFEEGRLMKAYVTGDSDAADTLRFISGRMNRLFNKYFIK
jgi:predicted metal-dependent phosphoesterase TrpH